jgi:hypothetical protein
MSPARTCRRRRRQLAFEFADIVSRPALRGLLFAVWDGGARAVSAPGMRALGR